MAEPDTVSTSVKEKERALRRQIIEDRTRCPSCGAKLRDATDEFNGGTIDPKCTAFFIISTDIVHAVGACRKNCRYSGYNKQK